MIVWSSSGLALIFPWHDDSPLSFIIIIIIIIATQRFCIGTKSYPYLTRLLALMGHHTW